eukprot:6196616-Pleurochrysis_carterae.AAC.1
MAASELFSTWAVRARPFWGISGLLDNATSAAGRIARIAVAASRGVAMADLAAVAASASDPAPADPLDAEAAAAARIEHRLLF